MTAVKNNGTWREQRINLAPRESETVYFNDTKPNHILVSNPTSAAIYIGVNGIVNPQTYDMIIPPFATKLFARMLYTTRLYIYSDSQATVGVSVTSWEGDFDPASVAQSMEMVGGGADGLLGIVEINNILSSLPSGDNVIGGVFIKRFDAPLPQGNNLIGHTIVDSGNVAVTALPQTGATYKKITAAAPGDVVVKTGKGFVYQLASDVEVTLCDAAAPAWKKGEFKSDTALICNTSIAVRFAAAGDAFILFN